MAPICAICCDKQINYGCKCDTCKKSLCVDCYDKIIDRTDDETYNYKCPFCKNENEKEIEELQPKQIIKLFNKSDNIIKKLLIDNFTLHEEILELSTQQHIFKDKVDILKEIIRTMKAVHHTLIIDYNILKASVPEVKTKKINKYQEYIKDNFKTFKNENPDKSNQIIFKMLASEWKNKN